MQQGMFSMTACLPEITAGRATTPSLTQDRITCYIEVTMIILYRSQMRRTDLFCAWFFRAGSNANVVITKEANQVHRGCLGSR